MVRTIEYLDYTIITTYAIIVVSLARSVQLAVKAEWLKLNHKRLIPADDPSGYRLGEPVKIAGGTHLHEYVFTHTHALFVHLRTRMIHDTRTLLSDEMNNPLYVTLLQRTSSCRRTRTPRTPMRPTPPLMIRYYYYYSHSHYSYYHYCSYSYSTPSFFIPFLYYVCVLVLSSFCYLLVFWHLLFFF